MNSLGIFQSHKKAIPTPMTRGEWCNYRDWVLPEYENGEDAGYMLEYLDSKPNDDRHEGEITWMPKDSFDSGYTKLSPENLAVGETFSFGEAVRMAKLGYKVARKGWNGSGMFAYIVPANSYPVERNTGSPVDGLFENNMAPYRAYWALKTAQDDVSTWAPSGSGSLAEDWVLVK